MPSSGTIQLKSYVVVVVGVVVFVRYIYISACQSFVPLHRFDKVFLEFCVLLRLRLWFCFAYPVVRFIHSFLSYFLPLSTVFYDALSFHAIFLLGIFFLLSISNEFSIYWGFVCPFSTFTFYFVVEEKWYKSKAHSSQTIVLFISPALVLLSFGSVEVYFLLSLLFVIS